MAATRVLQAYDLPSSTRITPIRFTNNAVFQVETGARGDGHSPGERFVLRLHRPGYRTPMQTQSELMYLASLAAATGIRVPQPVPARDGALVVPAPVDRPEGNGDVAGERRHADLLTWVEGTVLRPGDGLDERGVTRLGETLGRLHAFAAQYELPAGNNLPRWDAVGLFTEHSSFRPGPTEQWMRGRLAEDRLLFQEVAERTGAVLETLGQSREVWGVIHADYILGNSRFAGPDDPHPGIIDFDDCGWGCFLYDLCPLLGNLSDYDTFPALRRAFLSGYRRVRPLPEAWEPYFPLLMAARHAVSCLWVVGLASSGGAAEYAPRVDEHLAYRFSEIRRCLMLAG